ncbi:hypothetical protein DSO57_1011101 [Entomophthora muscae]|uniref:Uncharacterized protein n=1 Tax=Entomophthora muscae TaxID=34485 RepID=A0ACC2T6T8_9FUNG|nr:hypothetical protein DSO57_1011101 [Entomophthora muscae]
MAPPLTPFDLWDRSKKPQTSREKEIPPTRRRESQAPSLTWSSPGESEDSEVHGYFPGPSTPAWAAMAELPQYAEVLLNWVYNTKRSKD